MKFHKDGILPEASIFVFGSNLAGRHGKGAALIAKVRYGARYGSGEGIMGNSYAIPTKDHNLHSLPIFTIKNHVDQFILFATNYHERDFFITRVGCGLAGYMDSEIAPLFRGCHDNCSFAEEWKEFLL